MISEAIKSKSYAPLEYILSCGCTVAARFMDLQQIANHVFCRKHDGRYFIIETLYPKND